MISLDNLKAGYPWECIEYASKNNLLKNKGWEWINDYIDAGKNLVQMVHTYRISTFKQYNTSMGLNFQEATSMHFNLMNKTETIYGKQQSTQKLIR